MGDLLLIENWPFGFTIFELIYFDVTIGFLLWPFIAIFFPESLLLIHVQISRAVSIQRKIKIENKPVQIDIDVGHIKNYLESIPEDLRTDLASA